jgi:DNA processing protein
MAEELSSAMRDLLALTLVPGLGPRLTAALLERFGSASAACQATEYELGQVTHIGTKLARAFAEALQTLDVEAEIQRIERFGVHLSALGSAGYPPALTAIADPPHLLYVRGAIQPADAKAIAVVGSRQCTPYGKRVTERLAADLARAGYTVVSGLARGIDGAAHRGALDAGGRTIAVLAGGLSSIYPPEHEDLARDVEARGALVAETPMAMQPQRGMFHARNRLISGLSRAVVIVEANDRSGALITARHAAEQGREVFAIPANVDSSTSAGTLRLLRQGARLIRHVDDLLEDLQGIAVPTPAPEVESIDEVRAPAAPMRPANLEPVPASIWDFLEEAKHIDEITRAVGLPISELARLLTTMELKKLVRRLPGNQYERR